MMKEQKNDSMHVLSRFGKDKRQHTSQGVERNERRPRLQRDAADSEHTPSSRPRRASYNPHFSEDNRPMFGERRNSERGERSYNRGERNYSDRRQEGGRFGRRQEEATYGTYADQDRQREERSFGRSDKKSFRSDKKRSFGERNNEGRKFGGRSSEGRKFEGRSQEGRKFEGRKFEGRKFEGRSQEGRSYGKNFRKSDDRPSYPKYNPEKQMGAIRLNRFIAQSGICSRREADDFILAGVVSVNGQIVSELGTKVMPTDEVRFNDSRIQGEKKVYLILNKPKGYVTSLDDPHATQTVMELVKGACSERIYPVGRLDKNSLGLLLFTNDGDLTKQLTHPVYAKKKIYQVSLDKPLTRADMDRLAEGITLEDGEIHADEISYVAENKMEVGVEIHSGRNRIVRRMFEFVGYEVKKLDRVYYAGLTKKNLKRGQWRFLTDDEVRRLKTGQYE